MKLFIRGMGVGMIITTLIVAIAYGISGSKISDSEIRKRAKALGMTEQSDSIFSTHSPNEDEASGQATDVTLQSADISDQAASSSTVPPKKVNPIDATTEKPQDTATSDSQEDSHGQGYTLQIKSGESSYTICKRLEEAGLIESAVEMDTYMRKNNYQRRIQVGEFQIEKGMTYEQIAKKIIK